MSKSTDGDVRRLVHSMGCAHGPCHGRANTSGSSDERVGLRAYNFGSYDRRSSTFSRRDVGLNGLVK